MAELPDDVRLSLARSHSRPGSPTAAGRVAGSAFDALAEQQPHGALAPHASVQAPRAAAAAAPAAALRTSTASMASLLAASISDDNSSLAAADVVEELQRLEQELGIRVRRRALGDVWRAGTGLRGRPLCLCCMSTSHKACKDATCSSCISPNFLL